MNEKSKTQLILYLNNKNWDNCFVIIQIQFLEIFLKTKGFIDFEYEYDVQGDMILLNVTYIYIIIG